ncbi:GH92 family glycosyl hydrolase [Mycetocola reblochoni]|uniref:Alpha-1,2-mannosidase n=1 Tax=Mycetocola reblochoni REB411 TaxID=1255698 RepID=A0A1R4JIZ5_9MICO|nr:GH92 family glycosyl hydrolase [Mycetocola reblochoni]SJN31755.1 Alpha-1,2-mannosidase [Mycetocola reblochoni REB411]
MRRSDHSTVRRPLRFRLAAGTVALALAVVAGAGASSPATAAEPDWVDSPVEHVDTLNGTGIGGTTVGSINNFPGPAVPFGMVQFSPDTTSTYAGYQYHNDRMTGFSMNHASAGCYVFGDVPVLPTTGDIGSEPWSATQRYTHDNEIGEPGYYAVDFPDSGIRSELTATDRVGLSRISYPEGKDAQFMVRPGGSLAGNSAADLQVIDARTVVGSATTGNFCGKGNSYTIYFQLSFDQDFIAHGTWDGQSVQPGSDTASSERAGAYVTFPEGTTLQAKLSVSYVSIEGAAANMAAEAPGWDFDAVRSAGAERWNDALSRVQISQGSDADVETFYTSLYRSLLHPNVFNDADGRYIGFDGEIHTVEEGRTQYANFSDWDTYRTLIPLQTLLFPDVASDMAQSLVVDAEQSGSLPRWPVANSATGQMTGDSVSAVLAQIHAFGGTDFDADTALDYMIAAADNGGAGLGTYVQRPGAAIYEERGYAPQVEAFRGDHQIVGASITLEWSIDDFAIGRLASALGEADVAERFQQRSNYWQNLFDPAQTAIAARADDGSFLDASDFGSGFGQAGFDEGNAEQYLWMVPQNIGGLVSALGGREATAARLDTFMTHLNAGANEPYLWAGNEPNFLVPWIYNYLGQPGKTQAAVDRIRTSLFTAEPDGAPGNDDLGAMSSWYVWAAMGVIPATPGTTLLTVNTPTFDHVRIALGDDRSLTINAPGAGSGERFIDGMTVDGTASDSTALPEELLRTGGTVDLALTAQQGSDWGTAASSAPASFGEGGTGFALSVAPSVEVTAGGTGSVGLTATAFDEEIETIRVAATASEDGITAEAEPIDVSDGTGAATGAVRIAASSEVPDGFYPVTIIASAGGHERSQSVTVQVADEGSFARAVNIIGTATSATRAGADFDTAGNSYAREELALASLTPGSSFAVGELTARWPSSPAGFADAVRPDEQTILVSDNTTSISFVGAARDGGAQSQATVAFDDGSTATVPLELGDWVIPSADGQPVYGNSIVAKMPMRYATTEQQGAYVYATAPFTAPDERTIVSVTLPGGGDADRLRLFAIADNGTDASPVETALDVGLSAETIVEGESVTATVTVDPVTEGWVVIQEQGSGTASPANRAGAAAPDDGTAVVDGLADIVLTPSGVGVHAYMATFVPASPEEAAGSEASFRVTVTAKDDGTQAGGSDDASADGGSSDGSSDGSSADGSSSATSGSSADGSSSATGGSSTDGGPSANGGSSDDDAPSAGASTGLLGETGTSGATWLLVALGALAAILVSIRMIRRSATR